MRAIGQHGALACFSAGRVGLLVQDRGDLTTVAADQQLALRVPQQPPLDERTDLWAAEIGVHCNGAYCSYERGDTLGQAVVAGRDNNIIADGKRIVMSLSLPEDSTGLTLYFTVTATELDTAGATTGTAIKATVYPRESSGGASVFESNPDMSHQFAVGEWTARNNPQPKEKRGASYYSPTLDPQNNVAHELYN
eukprot:SAG31_NODE_11417_length_1033_cov_0.891863_1_plen_194_part_00